ncbi:MAG: hypothetical protein C4554_09455 [Dethiobacter sp.]|jgi:pyrrolysyl-tRNA synthetase-like protein|nr:MAG: hypothetical protein C4554_09455 [Dethiobacter sp.]
MPLKNVIEAKKQKGEKIDNKVRYIQKHKPIFSVLEKIKLWPSSSGILHGIKHLTRDGNYIVIETHCHEQIKVRISKNSRAARWLRNKWAERVCTVCRIPSWKVNKYLNTSFK